ncbi:AAA family ATPase [Streptomyces sp. NPDC001307]|uniref:helix-turn-helix transcriptional regulator n=1 Tax=Streptomyces sp. NPDC001307 TaxID=3364560 RepID=UPI0036AA0481
MLYGREAELRLLSDLVSRGRAGGGGAVLLRGEAGIGKTTLLHAVQEDAVAHGCRALSALGVQSEASVPFAGLHQLLNPMLVGRSPFLAARQQEALEVAFGTAEGAAPGMFSVGLASLELISGLAGRSPLLLVIDDAHWIDGPSIEVLAFVARRLEAERAVMLLAVREGHDTPLNDAGLPELQLAQLDSDAARKLLTARAPDLHHSLRDRLLAEAAGNPLALIELPAALGDDAGAEETTLPWLPTTRRLERSFLSRASTLPDLAQTVLLIAAADDEGDLAEIFQAAELLDGTAPSVASLEPAVDAGLIEIRGREIRFRHPLIRSAIYNATTPSRRLAGHAALATVLAGQQERRARHRAAATPGVDDDVALDLEAAAVRALGRGAPRAAAEALRHAAYLSDPDTHRGRLLLRAAEINFELGDVTVARRQLAEAEPAKLGSGERLRLTLWTEAFNEESWYSPERVRAFADVADRLAYAESGGAALALRALWPLSISCWYGDPTQETRDIVVKAARRLQTRDSEPMVLSIAACADPAEETAWVIDAVGRLTPEAVRDPAEQHALGASLTAVWAYDLSWPFLCAAVEGLRREGRLGLLGEALASQAWAAIHLGKHRLARTAAEEARRLSRDTGRPRWALVADLAIATLASERGEPDIANEIIRTTEAELLSVGAQSILGFAQFARGRYAMVNNQYNDAFEQLARVLDRNDIAYHPFVGYQGIGDLIEAAVRTGRDEEAQHYAAQLGALAEKTTAPYLRAMVAYVGPLVAPDEKVESLYKSALDTRALTNWPFHRARLLLGYGRWLRRQRRLVEARRPLRAAVESFDALGVKAFGQDARAELRAAGETVGGPGLDRVDTLTPQELQIAKMAAGGLTNREIGARLFISHRTVGQHLHRIFPKLGITSRGQLHLADLGGD